MSQPALPDPMEAGLAVPGAGQWSTWRRFLGQGAIWAVLLVLVVISTVVSPVFLTTRNISTLLKQAAALGIVSVGQTLAILTGGIDLSVASVMALMSVVAASVEKGQAILYLPAALLWLGFPPVFRFFNDTATTEIYRLNSSHGSISYAVSLDRKSTRLNSSHGSISYAVFCLKKHNAYARTTRASARTHIWHKRLSTRLG